MQTRESRGGDEPRAPRTTGSGTALSRGVSMRACDLRRIAARLTDVQRAKTGKEGQG